MLPYLLLVFAVPLKCQNLVSNGSFEAYSFCPNYIGELYSAISWTNPVTNSTPDYFNRCSNNVWVPKNPLGTQNARTGNAYAGIVLTDQPGDYREYMETEFTTPLMAGQCYQFSLYWSLGETYSRYVLSDIGVYFSTTPTINYSNTVGPLPYSPQINNPPNNRADTSSWKQVSGTYVASGGERFMIIGNFTSNFSDTVIQDSSIHKLSCYVFIDDVSLAPCSNTSLNNFRYTQRNYLGPTIFQDEFILFSQETTPYNLQLIDITGRTVFERTINPNIPIETTMLAPGIYHYRITSPNQDISSGRVLKN